MILNAGLLVLFYASTRASEKMKQDHEETCKLLDNIEPFDMRPLPALCKILSCMYGSVVIGILIVIITQVGRRG